MELITKDKCHPIIESGPRFDWMTINSIVDKNKDAEHINSVMNDAKYEYIQEENNRTLGYHSNYDVGKWEEYGLLEMDRNHNLVPDDEAMTQNDDKKYDHNDVNELEAERERGK